MKFEPAGDGSMYVSFGLVSRNLNIYEGQITIPDGQQTASRDIKQDLRAVLSDVTGHHVGFKGLTGQVRETVGRSSFFFGQTIPQWVTTPTLLFKIYPGHAEEFVPRTPTPRDIVVPHAFQWRRFPTKGDDIEELVGDGAYHVVVLQLPPGTKNVDVNPPALGAFTLTVGGRPLLICFVQDDNDRQRGWVPTRILRSWTNPAQPV
jgi:hypothetical protein